MIVLRVLGLGGAPAGAPVGVIDGPTFWEAPPALFGRLIIAAA